MNTGKKILIADDEPDILEIIQFNLQTEGYEVVTAKNGDEAFEKAKKFLPDLVMLDYKLSGARGDDICRQIKTHQHLNNIPVIICSAYLNKNDLLTCGCDAIITKPFGLDELVDTVNGLVYSD